MARVLSLASLAILVSAVPTAPASIHAQSAEPRLPPSFVYVAAEHLWSDSGMDVTKGDQLRFCATGEIKVAQNATTGPAGVSDLSFGLPVRTLPGGALIGAVDHSAFPIGANTSLIKMPASGRLLLGVNDTSFLDNSGHFDVRIDRAPLLTPKCAGK